MANPLGFDSAVLYLKPGIAVCDQLWGLAERAVGVKVVNIDDVPERPAWLRGVPTFVLACGGPVLKGTAAIEAVKKRVSQELRPAERCNAPAAGLDWSSSECAPEEGGSLGFGDGAISADAEPAAVTLEEMLRRRGQA